MSDPMGYHVTDQSRRLRRLCSSIAVVSLLLGILAVDDGSRLSWEGFPDFLPAHLSPVTQQHLVHQLCLYHRYSAHVSQ